MNILLFVLALASGVLAVGCSVTTAVEIATGRMRFPGDPSAWGALVFHGATALLTLWLAGLALGY